MAVSKVVYLSDGERERNEIARITALVASGNATEWQIENAPRQIAQLEANIIEHTFNAETDTILSETEYNKTAVRFMPETVGRTYEIKHSSSYLGDGDSNYYVQATIINDDGTTYGFTIDGNGWYPTTKTHERGSTVDAAEELVEKMLAVKAENARLAAIRVYNDSATDVAKGRTVVVVRGRKVAKGTSGVVFWVGEDNYGKLKIGFNDQNGAVQWTAASNVDVVAEPFGDND